MASKRSSSRVYLSAAHKSSGKTSVAMGLLAALSERGLAIQPFKKGPDYIDPMWLRRASRRACYNLDYNTQDESEIAELFDRRAATADLALVEGNKGLYDGIDPEGRDCNAALAKLLHAPVVLVLDAEGVTRGLVPLVLGYQAFDPDVSIKGVILNKVASARHESKLRNSLERYTDVSILGAVGRDEALVVTERHLGLTTPCEIGQSGCKIGRLKRAVSEGIDLDRFVEIAGSAAVPRTLQTSSGRKATANVRIGVARDAAFCFYYADDLEALERAGAELVFFNALEDVRFPGVDGLFIGGGFPETQMARLEANSGMRHQIRDAIVRGLPTYAECGGMMYLCRTIRWREDRRDMVGAIPFDAQMHERPQGRGLVRVEETGACPWHMSTSRNAPAQHAAHEFHYASLENGPPEMDYAYRVLRGHGINGQHDGIVMGNLTASFCHLRDTNSNRWAERFVAFVRSCRDRPAPHEIRTCDEVPGVA
ncbi:MAG: cobyrinate a,c-diamide synthase [Hyphomicrobiaceae bacterium]|nr:cobyrinate a,c-diamide synthase [Hyphomicrobiaceae bacterium]